MEYFCFCQGIKQGVFEIGNCFWAHQNWCPNFDRLATNKKIKPQKFETLL